MKEKKKKKSMASLYAVAIKYPGGNTKNLFSNPRQYQRMEREDKILISREYKKVNQADRITSEQQHPRQGQADQ